MTAGLDSPSDKSVSVIVPVYRDLPATRNCLESLLTSELPANVSITIINDGSPEQQLSSYCRSLAEKSAVRLVTNERNLGFVATANKGFDLDSNADVVLLNSDTVVPAGWLQRLSACAYREPGIGTVTPFSNNGTICSYPVISASNILPEGWSVRELDELFQQANAGVHGEIPTGVGFCMYFKRACLRDTGYFDEESFGHGYGEECDFSLRASALGWKHAVAADLFVFHAGGASFAGEAAGRKAAADGIMARLHPDYHNLITEFLLSDPLYAFRRRVDELRLGRKPTDIVAVLAAHQRYTELVLAQAGEYRSAMVEEQQQRRFLEQLLEDCRDQFSATDRALAEAWEMLDKLHAEIANLHGELALANERSVLLQERIEVMERSRSWRYTAWLRRERTRG